MIGKKIDSGFRDWDLLEHELLLQAKIKIREYILELQDQQELITDRHNYMMSLDKQDGTRRYLNTFDLDEVLGGSIFDCLIQEQGINDFEPFALVEYKSWCKGHYGVLKPSQKKALVKLAKKANLPAFCVWSVDLEDGTYNWYVSCVYSTTGGIIEELEVMTDRQFYKWKMKMRGLENTVCHQYLKTLSDTLSRNSNNILERIKKEGLK